MKTIAELIKEDNQSRRLTKGFVIFMIISYMILCCCFFGLISSLPFQGVGIIRWIVPTILTIFFGCVYYFDLIKNKLWAFSKNSKWDRTISEGKTKLFDTDGIVFVKKGALLITASSFYYCSEENKEEILVEIPDGKRNLFFLAYSEQFQLRTKEKMLIIFNDLSSIADMKREQEIIKII